jgi:site-specific DNA-methyltransferase (adenine-specific)
MPPDDDLSLDQAAERLRTDGFYVHVSTERELLMASRTPIESAVVERAVILRRASGWLLSANSYRVDRIDHASLRSAVDRALRLCQALRIREEHLARCVSRDSTQPLAYAPLGDHLADALITDPPYCLLTRRRKKGDLRDPKGKKNEGREVRRFEDLSEYRAFTRSWLTLAVARLKRDAPLVIWTNHLGKEPIRAVAHELGFIKQVGTFTWGKRATGRNAGEELLRVVEVALIFERAHDSFSVARRFSLMSLGLDAPPVPWAMVAGYDDDGEAARWGNHPNHKPFGVLEPLIRTYSQVGDLILDPFAGSGSIPAAALKLGRRAYCIELDPTWADRVTQRLQSS